MRVITVEAIKRNSRIEGDVEDAYLSEIGKVAEEAVEQALRQSWGEVSRRYGGIPVALRHACLMLADHLYTNRGATTYVNTAVMPYGVTMLIRPYVRLG